MEYLIKFVFENWMNWLMSVITFVIILYCLSTFTLATARSIIEMQWKCKRQYDVDVLTAFSKSQEKQLLKD